jgi:hypothetical protein
VAYEYKPRTKAQFIALLRDKALAKKEMRVPCEVLVRQMVEGHADLQLPFESCEGAAAAIASDDYQIIACRDEMFQRDNWLTVTNAKGTEWGTWHRKCLPGEKVLAYKGSPLISTTCLNVDIPALPQKAPPVASAPPPAKPAAPTFVTGACPSGYTLIANAWSMKTLPSGKLLPGMKEEAESLIQAANERDSQEAMKLAAYQPEAFSRTLGKRLREEVKVRAPIAADLLIRYLDPQTAKVVRELGTIRMERGVGSFRFSEDPRSYIIETIWPPDFVSPAMSGGERRVRMFPNEWGKFCAMNVHGALLP